MFYSIVFLLPPFPLPFEQEALHFPFTLGFTNYVAGLVFRACCWMFRVGGWWSTSLVGGKASETSLMDKSGTDWYLMVGKDLQLHIGKLVREEGNWIVDFGLTIRA